ncbi:MAG: TolC family protein [Kiritimatiellia bacterium]|nr:TolC family protein [Lentisphaerota bacterium]
MPPEPRNIRRTCSLLCAALLPLSLAADEALPALRLTLAEAVVMALENNPLFHVERLQPDFWRTYEQEARAEFDPVLAAEAARTRTDGEVDTTSPVPPAYLDERAGAWEGGAALEQRLPTGTRISLGAELSRARTDFAPDPGAEFDDRRDLTRINLTLTQSLLRGLGPSVNLARLRQARIDTLISEHELRAAAETLVSRVELAGWDYVLAGRRMEIYQESLQLAERQRDEVRERILVGHLAEIELAAAEAEVAQRRESLINARSVLAQRQLMLLRLLAPPSGQGLWECSLVIEDEPFVPEEDPEPVLNHVKRALELRPELREAQLLTARGELEVAHTRNGMLPRLDFFITLGRTTYADSFGESGRETERTENILKGGLRLEYPPLNRADRARHRRSVNQLEQAQLALANLEDLVQTEVRVAMLEVQRSHEQIAATRATRLHREESLRAETEKFRVGKSTSMLVAQAQRDLVASRIAEVESVISHLKARLELYRLDGSLLRRRGLEHAG